MIEIELYPPVEEKYSEDYNIFYEVKLYARTVDMLFISKETGVIEIAMEFKLRDWKTAIQQALSYQIIADYTYVVLYYKNINKVNLERLEKYGIGLISASTDCFEILLKSKKNDMFVKELHEKVMREIQDGKYKLKPKPKVRKSDIK